MDSKLSESNYTVDYRDVKYPRLEFKTGNLLLVLPKDYQDETRILEKYQKWINNRILIIQEAFKKAQFKQIDWTRTMPEFRRLGNSILQRYKTELETDVKKLVYRKMNTKWASHSQKGTLTVNSLLRFLPEDLIEYVLYHELIHSKYGRKHDREFWKRMSKKFPESREKENDLLVYWFLVQKKLVRN